MEEFEVNNLRQLFMSLFTFPRNTKKTNIITFYHIYLNGRTSKLTSPAEQRCVRCRMDCTTSVFLDQETVIQFGERTRAPSVGERTHTWGKSKIKKCSVGIGIVFTYIGNHLACSVHASSSLSQFCNPPLQYQHFVRSRCPERQI